MSPQTLAAIRSSSSDCDAVSSRQPQHEERTSFMRKRAKGASVKDALKETLQAVAGRQRGGAKALAQVAGVSPRAAESWLYDASAPGTPQLLALAAEYDEVWDLVCLLTGRKPVALSARQRAVLAELLIKLTDEETP